MKTETKKQIIEKRKEIEQELKNLLVQYHSDFDLEYIKSVIYEEEGQDDLIKIITIFDRGQNIKELNNILEILNNAWNYFPHRSLKGLSPMGMLNKS